MESRICLFPGTFDPLTLGHVDIIQRALPLFDKIIVGIGVNTKKGASRFDSALRLKWIRDVFEDEPKVEGLIYEGLTVDICKQKGARCILRGIRYVSDFEYEKAIADMNRVIADVETMFLTCRPIYTSVASTLVREVYKNKGDVSTFVPPEVIADLYPDTKL